MRLTADSTLHDVFYAVWRPDGSELVACGGKGQKIACQFLLTITGIAERLEPCRLGAAVGMLRIEQIVANFFGCGGRLVYVRNWHRVSNGRTAAISRSQPMDYPHRRTLSRVRCIAWFCAPSVIVRRSIFRAFRKETNDSPSQWLLDLSMSRHGLGHTRGWIAIPVVLASMPHQDAPAGFDRSDQIDLFHGITNSPTLRAPGIWPPERSR